MMKYLLLLLAIYKGEKDFGWHVTINATEAGRTIWQCDHIVYRYNPELRSMAYEYTESYEFNTEQEAIECQLSKLKAATKQDGDIHQTYWDAHG